VFTDITILDMAQEEIHGPLLLLKDH